MASLRTLLEQDGFHRIRLKKLQTGHYKLNVRVNNVKGVFILDTGASTSCIGIDQTNRFILVNEDSEIKAAGAGAINMTTQLARNNELHIGDLKLTQVDFVLFDLVHVNEALEQANEEMVHGILGADLLKEYRAVIDYGRNCFYLKA